MEEKDKKEIKEKLKKAGLLALAGIGVMKTLSKDLNACTGICELGCGGHCQTCATGSSSQQQK